MSKPDKFERRFERQEERKKAAKMLVNPDDPPLPDTPVEQAHSGKKAGRNDPCPCGSGKKFKQCCGKAK